ATCDLVAEGWVALVEACRLAACAGGEPEDAALAAVAVDGGELGVAELHAPPVLDVGDPPPGRVALEMPLLLRHAPLRRALLELDRLGARQVGAVDQLPGDVERAVVIDADLGDDQHRLGAAHAPPAHLHPRRPTAAPRAPRSSFSAGSAR